MEYKKLMVTSSKGGIGKSTVSTGLGLAFARKGMKVLLVDCDFGNCCLDMILGLESRVLFTVSDVASGVAAAEDALLHPDTPGGENLFFCAAPRGGVPAPEKEALVSALHALEEAVKPDVVLLDTAAGIEVPAILASAYADGAIVVASQMPVSIRAAEMTARRLMTEGISYIRLVINAFESEAVKRRERAGILSIIDQTEIAAIGIVPRDRELMLAQENGEVPSVKSKAQRAFDNIAGRLTGDSVRLFTGIKGFRLKRLF